MTKKIVPISSVANINPKLPSGLSKSSSQIVSFVSMAGVSEAGQITTSSESEASEVVKGYRYFEKGDVLLAKITPCMENGKAALADNIPHQVAFGSTEFHVLRPSEKIDGRYLFYMVWNPSFRYVAERNMTGTAGQKRVPTDFLKRYKIPLPPIAEQRRIAAILDKADAVRRKRKEAIALTEELLRSAFLDMFGDPIKNPKGWDVEPLGKIATFIGGGTPSRKISRYFEGDICWATSKDMGTETLIDTQEHVTEEAIESSATKLVSPGCLLVVVKSKVLMKRLPVARTEVPTCFGQDLKAVIPSETWMTRYLQRHLKLGQQVLLQQARGANTEGLTLEHLRRYPVMMPPKEAVQQFAKLEVSLKQAKSKRQTSDQISNLLFNSLLQRAFRGDL